MVLQPVRLALKALRGICAAVLTPLNESLRPDAPRAIPYYRELLDSGCDALNVLGTTGEAMSVAIQDRAEYMEAIASALPVDRLMVGTGAAALGDAIRLTRHAFSCGFSAALVMPPFYYKNVSERGLLDYFGRLFDAVRPPPRSILLYHFPRLSCVPFTETLVKALLKRFPETIAGMKDSANDGDLERRLAANAGFAIYPSSERGLLETRAAGYAGVISATVALWPELAARVWRDGDRNEAERLTLMRAELDTADLIGAIRSRVAARRNDPAWLRSLPPL